ncbi:UDP-N-acetylglucosamine transferase subunit ALG13 [Litoreibacter ponti]|uniref:UDP-N-acetylglucosamine transferase subunit ALG13 n=1 Tax=Litoreibacter ponti TaxID=1510457 RepID=A0A2T6BPH1_9RHOB|nr:UDP-N-acetylglucosamine transferase subunit ALG13 [Litoreibacter ponti]
MIFVTVGTQLPFPRLISQMDSLADRTDEPILAQTGVAGSTVAMESFPTCTAPEMEHFCDAARLIVAHAGIGTVLMARRLGKPLVVVPRSHELGEHRNNHQIATARSLAGRPGIRVAWDVADVEAFLSEDIEPPNAAPSDSYASLLATLRDFAAA